MIIASGTQFHFYLPWGQSPFSIVFYNSVLNVKALVGAFNQENALIGAFSVIVKTDCETDGTLHSTMQYCTYREPCEVVLADLGEPGVVPHHVVAGGGHEGGVAEPRHHLRHKLQVGALLSHKKYCVREHALLPVTSVGTFSNFFLPLIYERCIVENS